MRMSSKWLLTLLIMVGLVAGIIAGQMLYDPAFKITMSDTEHAHPTALSTFYFIGDTIFLGLLKMLIMPLIATSVIVGVTSVGDFRDLGKVGIVTLVYYVATMAIAATIGLILVTSIQPGTRISDADVRAGESARRMCRRVNKPIKPKRTYKKTSPKARRACSGPCKTW